MSHQCSVEEKDQVPQPTANIFPNVVHDSVGSFFSSLVTHTQFAVQGAQDPSLQSCFPDGCLQRVLVPGLIPISD